MAKRGRKSNAEKAAQAQQQQEGGQPVAEGSNRTVDQSTFEKHRNNILHHVALKDAAVANLRNARKDAEKVGIDVKDLDLLSKLEKLDPLTRKKRLANVAMYANWIDLPLGGFAVMSGANTSEDDEQPQGAAPAVNDHQAYQAGYDARKANLARDRNSFPESAAGKRELWWNGWDDAERDISSGKLQAAA